MYFLVFIALFGIVGYLCTQKPNQEALYLSTFMVLYSSVVWIPFIVLIFVKLVYLKTKTRAHIFIPFAIMSMITLYLGVQGTL